MTSHLVQLRRILTERFSTEELHTLCFDLSVDYDSLSASGKAGKARELVTFLAQHDRVLECLEIGKELRPDILWERVQLALLEEAQRRVADPRRFQTRIDEFQDMLASREDRVERQRIRIAKGLEAQRLQMLAEQVERRKAERLRVVGQPPLDVADYFKNRWREQEKFEKLLAEPTTRLISIIGHSGMGKTALACKVLQDLEHHRWPYADEDLPVDGIVYLSTRTAGINLERLYLDCIKLLGGKQKERLNAVWTNPQLDTEQKVARLLEALSEGRYVLLLDNLEDLLDDQGQLADDDLRLFFEKAVGTTYGTQLVITSRVALAFRCAVLRFDRQVKLLEGLPIEDGVALLRELDPNGDYGLRDATEESLTQAVALTHGVPRALEVLAGILANDPFVTLDEVLKTFYKQENVVQALVEENYKRLDRDARRVIEALSVFGRPVPPLAVDYLLEPFAPGLDVPGILRRLTRTNIVNVDRAAKTVTLHPVDQDYAYSRLPEEDEAESDYTRQALERRTADYYVQLRTPEKTWESINDLEPQLAEFEHRVRAGDHDDACRVLNAIDFNYLHKWGHFRRLVELREGLVEKLADSGLNAANLLHLGRAYRVLGQTERAIQLYKEALTVAREFGHRRIEGEILGSLSIAYSDDGKIEQGIELNEQARTIAHAIGDYEGEARHLGNIGYAHAHIGDFKEALHFIKSALIISRKIGAHRREAVQLCNLGDVYQALGEMEKAILLNERALAIARSIGHRWGESGALDGLGTSYSAMGQTEKATKFYKESLSIACEIGSRYAQSWSLLGISRIFLAKGRLSEAQQRCEEALSLKISDTGYEALMVMGAILLHQRDSSAGDVFIDAADHCRALLEKTAEAYKPRYTLATALVGQAICDSRWADASKRPDLLAPALAEYHLALENTAASGVVQDALHNLELIQAAGIEGLEPVFELLESVGHKPDLPEDLSDILEEVN